MKKIEIKKIDIPEIPTPKIHHIKFTVDETKLRMSK